MGEGVWGGGGGGGNPHMTSECGTNAESFLNRFDLLLIRVVRIISRDVLSVPTARGSCCNLPACTFAHP